jgi:hypothetical protein
MSMDIIEHATHLMRRIGGQNVNGRRECATQGGRARSGRNEVDQDVHGRWMCHVASNAMSPRH